MKNYINPGLKKEDTLFMSDDDYGNESLIYFEIATDEFKQNNDFLLEKKSSLYWEETDEYGIYD